MIIVVEGISAAGKTTYAKWFAQDHRVPEFEAQGRAPTTRDPAEQHAKFWAEHNARRFNAALAAERDHGFAICDTEPLKTHFTWCMARAGFTNFEEFDAAVPLVRQAIADRRLGFADRYLVKHIEPDVARAQKEGDVTRSRRRFDMHLALQSHLIEWFEALAEVLPGRVEFAWPEQAALLTDIQSKTPEANPRRFDVSAFDALIERLPR